MFPALQVLAHMAPRAAAVPVGGHIGLAGRAALGLGNSASADVPVVSKAVAAMHCRLEKLGHHWVLHDVAGVWGTYLNGRRVLATQVLRHQDVIELKGAIAFRYLDRPPQELQRPELEAAIAADPFDETAWAIYGDWLNENGSALAEQVTGDDTPEQRARWLGPLARSWLEGELELEWRHGHVVRAVLRRLQEYLVPRPEVLLTLLLEAPCARFLQSVEVDLSVTNDARGPARDKMAVALARALGRSWGAVGLKSFTFGPATRWKPSGGVYAALAAAAKRRPRLEAAPGHWVRRVEGAALELVAHPPELRAAAQVGQRFALPLDGTATVSPRNNALLKLLPSKALQPFAEAFVVQHLYDVWTVSPPGPETFLLCSQLKVNGRQRRAQCLRHGDLIELYPGLELRFVEEGRPA